MKTKTKAKSRARTLVKVKAHWVFPQAEGRKAYKVKAYSYKRKAPSKRRLAILKKARHVSAEVKPFVLGWQDSERGVGWQKFRSIEPEERVVYTYKAEILVPADYKSTSKGHSFASDKDRGAKNNKDELVLQYWHSKFESTIKQATVDFLEKIPEIRAYGPVTFLSIVLYRVSGVGPLTKKVWVPLRSFDEPEDVK